MPLFNRRIAELIQEAGFDFQESEQRLVISKSNADQILILILGITCLLGIGFYAIMSFFISSVVPILFSIPVCAFIIFQMARMWKKSGRFYLEIDLESGSFNLRFRDVDERISFFEINEIQCGCEAIDVHASDKLPQYMHFIEVLTVDNRPIRLLGLKDISSDPSVPFLEFYGLLKGAIKESMEKLSQNTIFDPDDFE